MLFASHGGWEAEGENGIWGRFNIWKWSSLENLVVMAAQLAELKRRWWIRSMWSSSRWRPAPKRCASCPSCWWRWWWWRGRPGRSPCLSCCWERQKRGPGRKREVGFRFWWLSRTQAMIRLTSGAPLWPPEERDDFENDKLSQQKSWTSCIVTILLPSLSSPSPHSSTSATLATSTS